MKTRFFILLFAIIASGSLYAEIISSGSCGSNATWELTDEGLLSISGSGAIDDYATHLKTPWADNRHDVKSIVIGDGITHIGRCNFYYFLNLVSITFPNTLQGIGEYAFNYCKSLESLQFPASLTSISSNAFDEMLGLTSISVAEDNPVFDSRDNCNAVIKTATNTLVLGCKTTQIPEGVTAIGAGAFRSNSALTSIVFPSTLERIGDNAFGGCIGLTSITLLSTTPPRVSGSSFSNISNINEIPLYVPDGAIDDYKSSGFKVFNIQEPENQTHKVRFFGFGGELVSEQDVLHNESAEEPELQEVEGYKLMGWDKDFSNITSDIDIYAKFAKILKGKNGNTEYEYIIKSNCD